MSWIPEDAPLEQVQRIFADDKFAAGTGCRVVEASRGHAVCELELTPAHRNGRGGVMGGVIFTLADFAIAVASNVGEEPTVSTNATIEFMSAVRGNRLIATVDTDKNGRTLGFYTCLVTDELGTRVARVVATNLHGR